MAESDQSVNLNPQKSARFFVDERRTDFWESNCVRLKISDNTEGGDDKKEQQETFIDMKGENRNNRKNNSNNIKNYKTRILTIQLCFENEIYCFSLSHITSLKDITL